MQSWTIHEPQTIALASDDGVTSININLAAGRLSVVGTDGPPRVEISRIASAPLHVDLTDGVLTVRNEGIAPWPGFLAAIWWWIHSARRFAADVSIAVPYETVCRLWVGVGSLVASTVHADVVADCVSGRMTLLGLDGTIRGKVVSGPIEALGCAGAITLETVSGEITLADSAASRVNAKTVSGSLTADLDNAPYDSQIHLETISGEITIRVREDSDLAVRLSAVGGRVTSDFPEFAVDRTWSGSISGTLGTGAGMLNAGAVNGNITLLRRPVDHDFGTGDQ
jgi:hypothetical protein